MGQGTESCGGYDIVYDPYDDIESNGFSVWHGQDRDYNVSEMSDPHIKNTINLCERLSLSANFSCDSDKWDAWIEVFESELRHRASSGIFIDRVKSTEKTTKSRKGDGKKVIRSIKKHKFKSSKQDMICHCGEKYTAKVADLKRGWALSCSKRCAAIRRDFGGPAAKIKV